MSRARGKVMEDKLRPKNSPGGSSHLPPSGHTGRLWPPPAQNVYYSFGGTVLVIDCEENDKATLLWSEEEEQKGEGVLVGLPAVHLCGICLATEFLGRL